MAILITATLSTHAGDTLEEQVASKAYTGTIEPGDYVAFVARPATGKVELIEVSDNTLEQVVVDAVARAPSWLQNDLRETFRRMDAKTRQSYAQEIGQAEDKLVDEIAFVAAHLSPEDRKYATPALLRQNAEQVYAVDAQLRYVEIVEHGKPGSDPDHYTTVRYRYLKDGKAETFELPRDQYYWWVVHPVLAQEPLAYVDPDTGNLAPPPKGVTWRDYMLAGMDSKASHRKHFIMNLVHTITDADLKAWDFGKARAYGSLGPSEVGANEVIRAGGSGEPVLIQFNPAGSKCKNSTQAQDYPMPDGIYLATTIPLEQAALNGHSELLENMLLAGPGRAVLRDWDVTSYSPYSKEPRKILIVRDQIPFGAVTDPNETVLTKTGRKYDVVTSAELATLIDDGKLSSAAKPHHNFNYNKIIIPSHQPRALYQVLASHRAAIETFVTNGGSFELHGATSETDDWSDLTMPGGIKTTKQTSANQFDELHEYGNALLGDVMKDVEYLWDGVRRCARHGAKETCPSGDRKMMDGDDAIDRIGWWVGQMLDRCVYEQRLLRQLPAGGAERSVFPQRVVRLHYGNCGEIYYAIGAASRAMLVSSMMIRGMLDHVWNEVYTPTGEWYPYDMDWSDAPMKVGDWSVSKDFDTRAYGHHNASLIGWRGDGQIVNRLGHLQPKDIDGMIDFAYTRHLDLEIKVLDANRHPVDGATVTLLTESYASAAQADRALFGLTDRDGVARLRVGNERNYYINIASPVGHHPQPMEIQNHYPSNKEFTPLITKAEAKAGASISREFVLTGADSTGKAYTKLAFPKASQEVWPEPTKDGVHQRMELNLKLAVEYRPAQSPLNRRHFIDSVAPGAADLYVTDAANYAKFKANEPFRAAVVKEGIHEASALKVDVPDPSKDWYVIVSNKRRLSFAELAEATLTLWKVSPDTGDDKSEDGGCSCGVGTRPAR